MLTAIFFNGIVDTQLSKVKNATKGILHAVILKENDRNHFQRKRAILKPSNVIHILRLQLFVDNNALNQT